MNIPYYTPNFYLSDLIKSIFASRNIAETQLMNYFSKLTNKKYVIITNSCRTALFLAYKSLPKQGQVITTPLTCKIAIEPILQSGNLVEFADINTGDLNIDVSDLESRINSSTLALQIIHLGGVPCDMNKILQVAKKHNLYTIEDCAQSLGSTFKGNYTGSFGDIACFSLVKNGYGISGGIFATNSLDQYNIALQLNNTFPKQSGLVVFYYIFRNLIETRRHSYIGRLLYSVLVRLKKGRQNHKDISSQFFQISAIPLKIAYIQNKKFKFLHERRKNIGKEYFMRLDPLQLNKNFDINCSSFTKYFLYNPYIDSYRSINFLNQVGVEVMHLEHKNGQPIQQKLIEDPSLKNYHLVHNCIISLPILEYMKQKDIELIVSCINDLMNKNNEYSD